MNLQQVWESAAKLVPLAVITGLVADWIRLRAKYRAEEKKHIARIIPEILDLRLAMKVIREFPRVFPKLAPKMFPPELRKQIPTDAYGVIAVQLLPVVINSLLPIDAKFTERYRSVVDEIAGFRPLLAYQLRGKEKYFDLRTLLSTHLAQLPGAPGFSSAVTGILDDECLPILDETLLLIAKSHSWWLWWRVKVCLRKPLPDVEPMFKKISKLFVEEIRKQNVTTPATRQNMPIADQNSPKQD